MKFSFSKKKNKGSKFAGNIIALDIGTTFVKVLVFNLNDKKVNVLSSARIRQQPDAMKGAMIINMRNVIENCNLAIEEAISKLEGDRPTHAVVGIAGELVQGLTIVANVKRDEPSEPTSKEEIEGIIENVKNRAFEDALVEVSEKTGIGKDQIDEIDTVINDTYIDGFRVADPFGFQGREIKFKIFSTFAPSIHANSLKTLVKSLGFEILNIVAEPYAITRAIHGGRDDNFGAIIIDIGGGTTDVAVVQRGGIVGTEMYAFGGKVFTRRLEYDFNVDYKQAENFKLKYSKKTLDDNLLLKVKTSINKDVPVWLDGLELALSEFEDIDVFPSEFLLCGGGSLLAELKDGIISHPWMKLLPFNRFPKVSHLIPEKLDLINDLTHSLDKPSDIAPLALARYALDLYLEELATDK